MMLVGTDPDFIPFVCERCGTFVESNIEDCVAGEEIPGGGTEPHVLPIVKTAGEVCSMKTEMMEASLAAAKAFLLGGGEQGKESVSVMLMGNLSGDEPKWHVEVVPPPPPPGARPCPMPVSGDAKLFDSQKEALEYGWELLADLRRVR